MGQTVELQGKFSSDLFKYMRITVSNCSGTVNGFGCRTAQEIQDFNDAHEMFEFNYYFINTLVNYQQVTPIINYLDDITHFTFSLTLGVSCNFYIESYELEIDDSLTPFKSVKTVKGALAGISPSIFSTFTPYSKGEYFRFYIRKSPTVQVMTQRFYKIDELLSYIGGLFGLIIMVIQVPMKYYNVCCFELSLATDLFTYKK